MARPNAPKPTQSVTHIQALRHAIAILTNTPIPMSTANVPVEVVVKKLQTMMLNMGGSY